MEDLAGVLLAAVTRLGRQRAGTPARRKYFCASTSAATCDQSAGTSMPFN